MVAVSCPAPNTCCCSGQRPLGYHDFTRQAGTENYGGVRPGCWVNALPVGGLVLLPDASSGCKCSYQNRTWIALEGT